MKRVIFKAVLTASILMCVFLFVCSLGFAAPYEAELFNLKQPDGSFVGVKVWGDEQYHFEKNLSSGPNDLFHNGNTDKFNDTTVPNSKWWDGTSSGFNISNISVVADTMTFVSNNGNVEPTFTPTAKPTPTATPKPTSRLVTYKLSGYVKPDFVYTDSNLNAGFKIEIVELGKAATTNTDGYYEITGILPNSSVYTIKVTKPDYLTRTISNVMIKSSGILGASSLPIDMWAGDIVRSGIQDDVINMSDIVEVSKGFNAVQGDTKYSSDYDINKDAAVNMADIMIIVKHFNKTTIDYPQLGIIVSTALPTSTPTVKPTFTPTVVATYTPTIKPSATSTPMPSDAATVASYPLPSCYSTSSQYTVKADSTNIPVIDTSAIFINYNYCNFSFSGTTTITITASETINTYKISPLALGITATKSGNTLTFTLSESRYLIVKINNLKDLVIAADALETNVPASSGTGIYNVKTQYDADSTGASMATTAIQNAINAANSAGGGIVYVPAGVYKCGNLVLKSNVSVYLAGGSVIRGSGNPSDYTTHFHKNSLNKDGTWFIYTATNANNVKIYGRGTIDGNGHYMRNTNSYLNNILVPLQCSNFTLDGITIRDSGLWATTVVRSNNVTIQNTKHFNNNELDYEDDAIDIEESQDVLVKHTVAVSEDDTYSFKTWDVATTDIAANWPGSPESQSNIVVDDALAWSRCGGFKVGDGVKQLQDGIVVKNSYVYRCWRALAVGHLYGTPSAQNIVFDNIDVEGFWPRSGVHTRWFDLSAKTGPIKNVVYNNINLRALGETSVMKGWSDTFNVSGVTLNNVCYNGVVATTLTELKITDVAYAAAPSFNTLKFEAEGYNLGSGVSYEACSDGGINIGSGNNGDYIAFKNVNFGSAAKTSVDLKVASANSGGSIEFRLDSPTGTLLGSWTVTSTGGWQTWSTKNIPLNAGTAVGTHTVYVKFVKSGSTSVANLTWFQFK